MIDPKVKKLRFERRRERALRPLLKERDAIDARIAELVCRLNFIRPLLEEAEKKAAGRPA